MPSRSSFSDVCRQVCKRSRPIVGRIRSIPVRLVRHSWHPMRRLSAAVRTGICGPSDFDIRNAFSAGITYDIPKPKVNGLARAVLADWSLQSFILARSAPPVDASDGNFFEFNGGVEADVGPDLVPGSRFTFSVHTVLRFFRLWEPSLRAHHALAEKVSIRTRLPIRPWIRAQGILSGKAMYQETFYGRSELGSGISQSTGIFGSTTRLDCSSERKCSTC